MGSPKRRRMKEEPVAAEKVVLPLDQAKAERFAHQALDFAKFGKWKHLFELLSKGSSPALVNLRPALREYALIHQAAWHGSALAVTQLLDSYGANPRLKTKAGQTAADVAREQGHARLAADLENRMLST